MDWNRLGEDTVPPPPPLFRTNRTRRVPSPVLIGHAASLSQVVGSVHPPISVGHIQAAGELDGWCVPPGPGGRRAGAEAPACAPWLHRCAGLTSGLRGCEPRLALPPQVQPRGPGWARRAFPGGPRGPRRRGGRRETEAVHQVRVAPRCRPGRVRSVREEGRDVSG